jgi:hypothetical protein
MSLWAEFKGDSETAVVVQEIEIEIDFLKREKARRLQEVGGGLTATEQGWHDALVWVRAKLEEVEGKSDVPN